MLLCGKWVYKGNKRQCSCVKESGGGGEGMEERESREGQQYHGFVCSSPFPTSPPPPPPHVPTPFTQALPSQPPSSFPSPIVSPPHPRALHPTPLLPPPPRKKVLTPRPLPCVTSMHDPVSISASSSYSACTSPCGTSASLHACSIRHICERYKNPGQLECSNASATPLSATTWCTPSTPSHTFRLLVHTPHT